MEIFETVHEGRSWVGSKDFHTTPEKIDEFYSSLQGSELELFEHVCAGLPCAKAYAHQYAERYGWTKEMLVQAKIYVPQKLEKPVPYFEKPWCCYENSFRNAERTGLRYVEGLAINPSGVQLHAWNSSDGTDVLDFTWPFQHVNKYFGIEWGTEWLKEHGFPSGGLVGHLYRKIQKDQRKGAAVV